MNIESIKNIHSIGSKLNVLYVEDEPIIREEVGALLSRIFGDVDLAYDGQMALEKYSQKEYDLIITDIKMPRLDGISLCQEVLQIKQNQAIIIISAYKEIDQLVSLLDMGVSGFISKPIDVQSFLQKLEVKVKEIYSRKMMIDKYQKIEQRYNENVKTQEVLQKKDLLTSVYNYKYLQECLKNEYKQGALLFNINDFKLINDYYSYVHGNHLLFQVANIFLKEAKKRDYNVFRISGDEFLLLYDGRELNISQLNKDVKEICSILENTRFNLIGIKNINIKVRAGISYSKDRLLEELNIALEYAKKNALTYTNYGEDLSANIKNIVKVKDILSDAIKNSLIIPVYQPIVMVSKDVKYEVLMRIEYEKGRLLTPEKFLSIAKEYNYYNEISEMLVFKAIDIIMKNEKIFSINISYLDMKNTPFMDKLEDKLKKYNIGDRIIFEIVESDIFEDLDIVDSFIKRFKAFNVKIAIDDFGSGYSNFAHIFKLKPNFIKLDGSLISNMLDDASIFTIIKMIINLAHKLNIEIIAEYVSSKEIYEALSSLGVDAMQGYYLGYPDRDIKDLQERYVL